MHYETPGETIAASPLLQRWNKKFGEKEQGEDPKLCFVEEIEDFSSEDGFFNVASIAEWRSQTWDHNRRDLTASLSDLYEKSGLTQKQREAMEMRVRRGKPKMKESVCASHLGISQQAISKHLAYAKKKIRKYIKKRGK